MKTGAIVTGIVAAVALGVSLYAFTMGASQYVTIDQARHSTADRLHLVANIDRSTVERDVMKQELRFTARDDHGDTIPVVYMGHAPANFNDADKVVVIGGMKNGAFVAHEMLVKCPSKYEEQPGKGKTS